MICPSCCAQVGPGDADCPHCGVDLALAAALAERQALASIPARKDSPYFADVILPRFGEYLLRTGYIDAGQLEIALEKQMQFEAEGKRPTLGQVLLDMGVVTREQLDLASMQQVQELQNTLREMNQRLEQRVVQRTRELQRATEKLAELDQLKANFVSNVSHELRTPLTKIKGFNALLNDSALGPITADQKNALDVTSAAIGELERLIDDLTRFSASARGEMTLRPTPFSLHELADTVVRSARSRNGTHDVQILLEIPASFPRAMADVEKIKWVVTQLVENAIKFTPAGGCVTLGAEENGSRLRVLVRDNGTGIPSDRLHELFEPFHQLDGGTTRRHGGTGLGLALVKRIVEAHQSTVSVESAPGRGSTFSFELPIASA
jgi:signal transduction histidine kinase